ncbi:hypothetical protein DEIPH_ctg052orf0020 [Deinococcus phoenicis]|uniref:Uncharacterized protein n=1 Tax=Deinococcus phoenicis TaxID=1476583 RepID=A0A016QLN9_9DEIO|nr:hypothetical protein [Deinococcus phoenicis]EYB67025.1 hypothetical protein DEIPH_ctg052orf0020 [Deinococcus phoenicis]
MDLAALLRLDFRPEDLGDMPGQFDARLGHIVTAAQARADATPAQQEAGARYLLLGAQLRQLTRQAERMKAASGAEMEQGLATRLAEVRRQQAEQLALSGLASSSRTLTRPRGVVFQPEVDL